jgi:hypothetical protein
MFDYIEKQSYFTPIISHQFLLTTKLITGKRLHFNLFQATKKINLNVSSMFSLTNASTPGHNAIKIMFEIS